VLGEDDWGYDDLDRRLKALRQKLIYDYQTREPETWEVPEHMKRKMKSSRKKKK
jgi:hypothetical protein